MYLCKWWRVLRQLFGKKWSSYYDSYRKRALELIALKYMAAGQNPDDISYAAWGIGYELSFPSTSSQINAHAVMNALSTLDSIEQVCGTHAYSFIPGVSVDRRIDRIWIAENSRLLWVRYDSQHPCQEDSLFDMTLPPNRVALNLDGQVISEETDHTCARKFMSFKDLGDTIYKGSRRGGHEIWDIAASPHPRCLWSTFVPDLKNVVSDPLQVFSRDDQSFKVSPVRSFVHHFIDGWMLPTKRPYYSADDRNASYHAEEYRGEEILAPVRFVYFRHRGVIDMLQLSWLDFHGNHNLWNPQLSRDSKYLVATVKLDRRDGDSTTQRSLIIWRVELPHPVLLWSNGIMLCTECDYTIAGEWLFIHCDRHGATAYSLTWVVPVSIDITWCIPASKPQGSLFFQVCGPRGDTVYCSGPHCGGFSVFKLVKRSEWLYFAVPLYLPTRNSHFTAEEAAAHHLGTIFYI